MSINSLKTCGIHRAFTPQCEACVTANVIGGGGNVAPTPTTETPAQRMDLSRSTKVEAIMTPSGEPAQRVVVYGQDKIGKTTFAAHAPKPGFICVELGLNPKVAEECGVVVFPRPKTWEDLVALAWNVATQEHDRETLVLDTGDWAEKLCFEFLCQQGRVRNIEEYGGGFHKCYTAAYQEQRRLIAALEACHKRGMHVIVLFHRKQYTVSNPEGEDYDTYDLNLYTGKNANAANLWREWADDILYLSNDVKVAAPLSGKGKGKAIDTGDARYIRTRGNVAYAAGCRNPLPDEMPIEWNAYIQAVLLGIPASAEVLIEKCETKIAALKSEDSRERAALILDRVKDNPTNLARLSSELSAALTAQGE